MGQDRLVFHATIGPKVHPVPIGRHACPFQGPGPRPRLDLLHERSSIYVDRRRRPSPCHPPNPHGIPTMCLPPRAPLSPTSDPDHLGCLPGPLRQLRPKGLLGLCPVVMGAPVGLRVPVLHAKRPSASALARRHLHKPEPVPAGSASCLGWVFHGSVYTIRPFFFFRATVARAPSVPPWTPLHQKIEPWVGPALGCKPPCPYPPPVI